MALRSMTGFGRAQGSVAGTALTVEIRSVNHKGLDLKISVPSALTGIETSLARLVRAKLGRGRVDIKLRLGESASGGRSIPVVDANAAKILHEQLQNLANDLGIQEPVSMKDLLVFRDQILRDPSTVLLGKEAWPEILTLVEEALALHISERDREGLALTKDLTARLKNIQVHVETIAKELPSCQQDYLDRLRERVTEAVTRFDLDQIPEERLLQEVVIFADRSDITEELTRARTHLTMLLSLIASHDPVKEGPVGKKLDFYFQELIRETNTTGSKSQSALIAGHVVEIRSEIDRLREQALNIS